MLDRRSAIFVGATLVLLIVAAATPQFLGDRVVDALGELAGADPRWLWLGGLLFFSVIVCNGCAWRAALGPCGGGSTGVTDAAARYGIGSLVNAVVPAGAGGAARIALFSRRIPGRDRIWVATGVAGAVGLARGPALALLVLAGALTGALPFWPVLVLAAALPLGVAVVLVARRWTPHVRVAHVLDAFRALGECPRAAGAVMGWIALGTAARVAGAAAVCAALGVHDPVRAALVMIPALLLAGIVPITPGNVGVGSGAAAVALSMSGVSFSTALSAGIAFQALETAVSVLGGSAAVAYLARPPVPIWWMRAAGTAGCICLAAALGATFFV